MRRRVSAVEFLLVLGLSFTPPTAGSGPVPGSSPDSERGRVELRRVHGLAAQPRYGACWSRALEELDARCRDLTAEGQSRLALRFTHCHLGSSGRHFPSCPEGSEVSRCTAGMDAVAFNTYTEFFTHTHDICHFLQSEAWQSRAESTMSRLTETSAGVAEQLQSTRQMAEDLIEAQTAALQAQKEILRNGEEMKVTLKYSTEGMLRLFSELRSVSVEQQVALSELFNKVSYLQSFMLMEAHSLTSWCYHAAALCTSFLLTSTPRSSRARLLLLGLVCLNFYLENKIYQFVLSSDGSEHQRMETFASYVSVLRRLMLCIGLSILLAACVRYTDPVQQSLQVLQQLRETQQSLQEALQHAESLRNCSTKKQDEKLPVEKKRGEERRRDEGCSLLLPSPADVSDLSHISTSGKTGRRTRPADVPTKDYISHNAPQSKQSPSRRPPPSSPLVYSVLVEDRQDRYSLRSRRSDTHRPSK